MKKGMLVFNALLLGIASLYYLTLTAIGVLLLGIGRTLLTPLGNYKQKFTILIKRIWLELTLTYLGFYFVHPVYIAYDERIWDIKRSVMISNHLTDYDWIFLLAIMKNLKMYDENCIILKHSLASLPLFGYAMKCFGYIFLKRSWDEDKIVLESGLEVLKGKDNYLLLLFPEGTYLTREAHLSSQKYANKLKYMINKKSGHLLTDKKKIIIEKNQINDKEKNQNQIKDEEKNQINDKQKNQNGEELKIYNPENTLIPRRKGFNMIVDQLNDTNEGILDVTLFVTPYSQYPPDVHTFKKVFLERERSLSFFCVIDFHPVTDENFLFDVFYSKEKMIESYKNEQKDLNSLFEFATLVYRLKKRNYIYKKIYMRSDYGYLILILQFICTVLIMNYVYYLIKK